jgi:peptidoglycan/LPS O-acetylase OafA/YrhL
MSKGTSIYLDILRGLAAIGVILAHAGQSFFSQEISWLSINGHDMVVIFFVLSGFVMSHAVGKIGVDWRSYAEARFTRIASVAYPALLVTVICDVIGRSIDSDLYVTVAREEGYWQRMLISTFFLQQSGPLASSPGSNAPFWSLAYEVWYYVLLGVWTFVADWKRKVLSVSVVAILAGPKVLVLMPVWVFGLLAHRYTVSIHSALKYSALVFAATGLLIVGVILDQWVVWGDKGNWVAVAPWYFSGGFFADYQMGLIVAIHLVACEQIMRNIGDGWISIFLVKCVRYLADRSFSSYAFHMPILYLISVAVPYDKNNSIEVFLAIALLCGIIVALHWFTEKRRNLWRIPFRMLIPPKLVSIARA